MDAFRPYRKKQLAEMRPYVVGESLPGVMVNDVDRANGSPKAGDMIARNPTNHADQWLVAAAFLAENYEPAHSEDAHV